MKKILFLFSILFSLLSLGVLAQNSDVSEKNLPDKTLNKNFELKDSVVINNIDNSKNELVKTLLKNKKQVSLMFDEEEEDGVNRAVESFKSGQQFSLDDENKKDDEDKKIKAKKELENEKSYIYLASIMYYSPLIWTVWINNTKITSENNDPKKELFIKSVGPDNAKVRWTLSMSKWKILSGKTDESLAPKINENNQVEINFTLKPNQTFMLNANTVKEGKIIGIVTKKIEDTKVVIDKLEIKK